MHKYGTTLAAIDNFGQVFDCGSCGNIHFQIGPMTMTLTPHAYMQLVDMVSTSAANFETWLQERTGDAMTHNDVEDSRENL